MSIALLTHVSANGNGNFTSSAIDTTGATLLVANLSHFNADATGQLTDSYGNTWVALPRQFQTDAAGRLFYSSNPAVGTGHTFTVTGAAFGALCVASFSGVNQLAPLDQSAGGKGTSSTATGGSLTPANANSLVISGCTARNTGNINSVNGGFTITDNVSTGSVIDSAIAYLIQTSATAANPAWTLSGSINWGVTNAVFIAGSVTPPAKPALVSAAVAEGNGNITSSAIDTTGASLLVVQVAAFGGMGTVSDSKGNTWTPATAHANSSTHQQLFYAVNPTVGSGHTFTVTSLPSGSFVAAAFSGIDTSSPFDTETGSSTGSGEGGPGSVSPANASSLVVSGVAYQNSGVEVVGIDSDFKIAGLDPSTGPPNSVIGSVLGFRPLAASVALNPTWFYSGAGASWAGDNVVFKGAGGAIVNETIALALTPAIANVPAATGRGALSLALTPAVALSAAAAAASAVALALTPALSVSGGIAVDETIDLDASPGIDVDNAALMRGSITLGATVAAGSAGGFTVAGDIALSSLAVISAEGAVLERPRVFRPGNISGDPSPFRPGGGSGENPNLFRPGS